MVGSVGLLLLVCVTGMDAYYSLRKQQKHTCGLGQYGSQSGSAQRLVVTQPGVTDWNIAVPMPPMCKNAIITGVDTIVCDTDVAPEVTMKDMVSARVHRNGQLRGYAAVNVTVYCVLSTYKSLAPWLQHADTRSIYEMLSSELISNEVMSGEFISNEVVSNGLTSSELVPKFTRNRTSTVVTPPVEVTTPPVEMTSQPEEVTLAPKILTAVVPPSYKVTIKITPSSPKKVKKQKPKSSKATLPLSSQEATTPQQPKFSTPYIVTPPQNSMMPSQNSVIPPPPHRGMQQQNPPPPHQAGEPPPHPRPPQYEETPSQYKGKPTSLQMNPSNYEKTTMEYAPEFTDTPPVYNVISSPFMITPWFRPLGLLSPRLRFWSRQRPLTIFPHF